MLALLDVVVAVGDIFSVSHLSVCKLQFAMATRRLDRGLQCKLRHLMSEPTSLQNSNKLNSLFQTNRLDIINKSGTVIAEEIIESEEVFVVNCAQNLSSIRP